MYQLIDNFIKSTKEIDSDIFPFLANKKNFNSGADSVYYSGPYWDDEEITEMIHSILKGKWLSSGEKVHKFEKQFSKKFGFDYSVMVRNILGGKMKMKLLFVLVDSLPQLPPLFKTD